MVMAKGSTAPRFLVTVARANQVLHSSAGRSISIGRGPACEVQLLDPHVSLRHGEILSTDQGVVFRDLESRNGSQVRRGSETIRVDVTTGHECLLVDGDQLRIGNPLEPVVLRVGIEGPNRTVQDDSPTEKNVTRFNRYADIESIRQRLGEDKRALQCLYKLLGRLTVMRDRDAMLKDVAGLLLESFENASHVTVYLRPRQASAPSDLVPAVQAGAAKADQFAPVLAVTRAGESSSPSPLSRLLLERVTVKGEGLLFEDGQRNFADSESVVASRIQSGLCVPLWDRMGIRGILQVDNRMATGAFSAQELDLVTLIGNHLALVLANIEMYENLVHLNQDLCDAMMRIRLLDTARDHLSRFVPEAVRRQVDKSPARPQFDMVDSEATILFLDIGGYTKLSEKLDRDEVSFLVERYFSSFIDDIYRNHGDINETAGDGLMIIFQADQPVEHARAGVRAALAIRRKTQEINRELVGEAHPIDVNMGINTGIVLLGSRRIQGVAGARWTYTATGMVTNVCARLAAHAVRGQILIGQETAARVRGLAALEDLGLVQFKNVAQPLPVFEVVGES
jgi:class 3 adenylate cyclase